MEKKFIPQACVDVEEGKTGPEFEGHLVIELLTFSERCRFPDQIGLDLAGNKKYGMLSSKNPEELTSEETAFMETHSKKAVGMMAIGAELIMPKLKTVELTHIETGDKITSVDELYADLRCNPILMELVNKYTFGFLEKKS